ncbi:MAG TPA: bis(5'-nucleosyl)-tetraphosphatase (symmetrical) YqeK [Bacilli bacterium]|nr:bis(5'-nucleosyl)-tetraphosphatase (symmetrical) YqeK [Bacilli bacterium]
MNEVQIEEIIRNTLSPQRFTHVCGVVAAADRLAQRFHVERQQARLAAWIHDYAREWPVDRWYEVAKERNIPEEFLSVAQVLHGPIVAEMMGELFDLEDADIANAVRYHTTGRVGMSELEKVVCLADYIEAGRTFPGVEDLREKAEHDLDLALASAFDGTIRHLLDKQASIFPLTVLARNDLWQRIKNKRTR